MDKQNTPDTAGLSTPDYKYGFSYPEEYVYKSQKGLSTDVVQELSHQKSEAAWMREARLKALDIFTAKPMPTWGADLSTIDFDDIYYYLRPTEKPEKSWEDLPDSIKETYDRLGIPEAEKKYLAGVKAQYESEVVYGSLLKSLEDKGVVFLGMDEALQKHPELVKEYFGTAIPAADNKFAALNSAVWSGGSFIYIPKNVTVELPLQAYFRINAANMGQFERTLIIADEGSQVHYVEGCTAPVYAADSLHSAVVEIIVKKGARVRYTTVQNWSSNVYNLVTKRALVHEESFMEWVDCNIGSKITMKYPAVYLLGRKARGEVLSMAYAGDGQHQDTGAKALHLASETSSKVTSKSISAGTGRSTYRGLLHVSPHAENCKSKVVCDALLLNEVSRTDTYPTMTVANKSAIIEHEASVSKIGEDTLFYLMSRGLTEDEASAMVVNGFIEPVVRELPMEYAVEMNRLIQLEMEGSVG